MHEEIIEKIKAECRIRNHSENSIKQYTYHASCFLKWVGDKPLDELTLTDARPESSLYLPFSQAYQYFYVAR